MRRFWEIERSSHKSRLVFRTMDIALNLPIPEPYMSLALRPYSPPKRHRCWTGRPPNFRPRHPYEDNIESGIIHARCKQ